MYCSSYLIWQNTIFYNCYAFLEHLENIENTEILKITIRIENIDMFLYLDALGIYIPYDIYIYIYIYICMYIHIYIYMYDTIRFVAVQRWGTTHDTMVCDGPGALHHTRAGAGRAELAGMRCDIAARYAEGAICYILYIACILICYILYIECYIL